MGVTGFLKQFFSNGDTENNNAKISSDLVPAMAKHKSNKIDNFDKSNATEQLDESKNNNNKSVNTKNVANVANLVTNEQLPRLTVDDLPAFSLENVDNLSNTDNKITNYANSINGTSSINGVGYTGGTSLINTNQPFVIDGLDELNELELVDSQGSFFVPPSDYTPLSGGDALLATTFNVSDELLNILGPKTSIKTKCLVTSLDSINNELTILHSKLAQCNAVYRHINNQFPHYKLNFVEVSDEVLLLERIDHLYSTANSPLLVAEQERLAQHHKLQLQKLNSSVNDQIKNIIFAKDSALQAGQNPLREMIADWFCTAHQAGASDLDIDLEIHPTYTGQEYWLVVRMRKNGKMLDIVREKTKLEIYQRLVTVFKVIADLDTGDNFSYVTGRIEAQLVYGSRSPKIEMRCNVAPLGAGLPASISIRFQSSQEFSPTLPELGMFPYQVDLVHHYVIEPTFGLILICGKINCGKSTTQTAILREKLRVHSDRKYVTIEDPVEIRIQGATQFTVDEKTKLEQGDLIYLETALRHNPDCLAIGEIRSRSSAELAINASIVGHTCFSTIHTSTATEVIERMLSLISKTDRSKLASALQCVISQRLIEKNCNVCEKKADPKSNSINRLNEYVQKIGWKKPVKFVIATGYMKDGSVCRACNGTGTTSRIGIFEILTFSMKLKNMILKGKYSGKIRRQAVKEGFKTLWINGLHRALLGDVSLTAVIDQLGRPDHDSEGLDPLIPFESDTAEFETGNLN